MSAQIQLFYKLVLPVVLVCSCSLFQLCVTPQVSSQSQAVPGSWYPVEDDFPTSPLLLVGVQGCSGVAEGGTGLLAECSDRKKLFVAQDCISLSTVQAGASPLLISPPSPAALPLCVLSSDLPPQPQCWLPPDSGAVFSHIIRHH